jgi:uncharacterized RDD family membrane protein YckC
MSGWSVPAYRPQVQLPQGVAVAAMGRRVGAWILDSILSGFLVLVPLILAILIGAFSLNGQALDQYDTGSRYPFDDVTAPLFNINAGPLWALAVLYMALNLVYYAGSWMAWGGTPCQRALGLRVGRVGDLGKLSVDAAVLRWTALYGVSMMLSTAVSVQMLVELSRIPTNEWLGTQSAYAPSGAYTTVAGVSTLISLGTLIWLIVLLVSAASHFAKQGLHDRLVGSIVVGQPPVPAAWPGYPPGPQGYPPQGYGQQAWPGYPPQASGYPPQASGYPGQGPGYPGQGAPWPGYPPQPPVSPPQPPANPPQTPPSWPPQGTPQPPPGPPADQPPEQPGS